MNRLQIGLLIDDWLPDYSVSASYSIEVRASEEQTWAALAKVDFANLAVVRVLMRLRGYRLGGGKNPSPLEPGRPHGAFVTLAAVGNEEILLGIAGRFWRPDGGIVPGLTPETFRTFQRQGYAKAVWNFSLAPSDDGTRLSTETRGQAFGRSATVKFRLYWIVVGPFSGLMRKAMLREVKRIAEQATG